MLTKPSYWKIDCMKSRDWNVFAVKEECYEMRKNYQIKTKHADAQVTEWMHVFAKNICKVKETTKYLGLPDRWKLENTASSPCFSSCREIGDHWNLASIYNSPCDEEWAEFTCGEYTLLECSSVGKW